MHNEAFVRAVMTERARDRDNAVFVSAVVNRMHRDEPETRTRRSRPVFFGLPALARRVVRRHPRVQVSGSARSTNDWIV